MGSAWKLTGTGESDLNKLLDDVEALAVPGEGKSGVDARFVLAAYLIHSRKVLRAVRALIATNFDDVIDPLVRASVEYAATCGWLMTSPDSHYERLVQALRRDLSLVLADYKGPVEIKMPEGMDEFFAGPQDKRPDMPELSAAAGLKPWYALYRLLSTMSHATLLAPLAGGRIRDDEGSLVRARDPRVSLLVVAKMTLHIAQLANDEFGWGREDQIAEVSARVTQEILGVGGIPMA